MDDSTISAPGCEQRPGAQRGMHAANPANAHKCAVSAMDAPAAAEMDSRSILCEGFGAISRIAVDMPGLSLAARALYAYLCAHANGSHRSWPASKRIVETLGVSENTFYKARAELSARGLVAWEVRNTAKGRRTVYVLNQLVSDLREPEEKFSTTTRDEKKFSTIPRSEPYLKNCGMATEKNPPEKKFSTIPRSEPYLKNCGMAPIPQNLRYAIKNKYVNLKEKSEKEISAAPAGRAEALDGGAARPLAEDERIAVEGVEAMEAVAPRPTRPSSAPKAAAAFARLVSSGEDPDAILAAWRAYAEWQRASGDPKRAMTVLSFLTKPTGLPAWRRGGEGAPSPVPAAHGKPGGDRAEAEGSEPEGYAELLRVFPKSPRGGARDAARRAYAALIAEGVPPERLLAAARAYAAKVREDGREFRYVMSLATFLSEPKGARSWMAAAEERDAERERADRARKAAQVSRALCGDDALKARLALEYAEAAGGELAAQAAKVRADGTDARVHARDTFMTLERMLSERANRPGWVEWAHDRIFQEGAR